MYTSDWNPSSIWIVSLDTRNKHNETKLYILVKINTNNLVLSWSLGHFYAIFISLKKWD